MQTRSSFPSIKSFPYEFATRSVLFCLSEKSSTFWKTGAESRVRLQITTADLTNLTQMASGLEKE